MARILFIHPYPGDTAPSQRFRFEQYVRGMEAMGYTIQRQAFWPDFAWAVLYRKGHYSLKIFGFLLGVLRRLFLLPQVVSCDWVFIHREAMPIGPPAIEWIIARLLRTKVIYDFDDAIWIPNTTTENRLIRFLKAHEKVGQICSWSYRVSAGNDYLAEFARQYNNRVVVNPTTIDTDNRHIPPITRTNHEVITLGWTGTHSTIKYLAPLKPIWEELVRQFGSKVRFLVIADKEPSLDWPQCEFRRWSRAQEIEDLLRIDIGLMPLNDDTWSKGKCGLKALQYMALGIPTVASPVGVNAQIIIHQKNGQLCREPSEWLASLQRLVTDPELRLLLGRAGRDTVVRSYSVASNKRTFESLFR